jgi:hypothetical protein
VVDLFQAGFYKHLSRLEGYAMRVFISWSGQRSAAVADALRYWLPKVIQALEPWMSADDIEKGTRWRSGLASELEESSVGIICLTRENLDSTWIHFEAGALSKQQRNTYVCTLLFKLEPTDVREPLAQFQHTRATKDDLRKLISTINNALGDSKLPEAELSESFEIWWPKLEERIAKVDDETQNDQPIRGDRELLEEVLSILRTNQAEHDAQIKSEVRAEIARSIEETIKKLKEGFEARAWSHLREHEDLYKQIQESKLEKEAKLTE